LVFKKVEHQRKLTLVFAVDVKHIHDLTDVFRENGIDARGVHGKTHHMERQELLKGFKRGEFPVLINCG
jgi:ATP-dependent helicase IRC3